MKLLEFVNGDPKLRWHIAWECWCGSGVSFGDCCIDQTPFKAPSPTKPPSPVTGKALNKCYASELGDCCDRLSAEHYVSEAVLHQINENNDLTVGGLPWLEGNRILTPKSLKAKILCVRHNSALSNLDAEAARLYKFCKMQQNRAEAEGTLHTLAVLSGLDIERWMLKVLCGLMASRSLGQETSCIPKEWLNILFGFSGFPIDSGLYACRSIGHKADSQIGVIARPIERAGRISGLGIQICGLEFVLSMRGIPKRQFDGRKFAYRPQGIYETGDKLEKLLVMSWPDGCDLDGGYITLTFA